MMHAGKETNTIWLEVPGAVVRRAWKFNHNPPADYHALALAAKEATFSNLKTSNGETYTLARLVMVTELVIAANHPDAEIFRQRFPNHIIISEI